MDLFVGNDFVAILKESLEIHMKYLWIPLQDLGFALKQYTWREGRVSGHVNKTISLGETR